MLPAPPTSVRATLALALALAAGCAADQRPEAPDPSAYWTTHALDRDRVPEPFKPVRFANPVTARYHMRRHFDDLRMIEQLLLAGKLDEGRTLASLLVRIPDDGGLADLDDHARRVSDAARELTAAPGLDEAIRRETRVAVECAECHAAAQGRVTFAAVPPLPPDRGTRDTRMARHRWAADRLWEGLVGPDDTRWTRGLAVLSETPMAFPPTNDAPFLATDLQKLARAQLDARATTLLEDRGAAYGEMLVRCTACHASLHVSVH